MTANSETVRGSTDLLPLTATLKFFIGCDLKSDNRPGGSSLNKVRAGVETPDLPMYVSRSGRLWRQAKCQ